MARFSEEWLTELLSKNEIADVIGERLQIKKQGTRYWASCPWHPEKKPSFSINPERQMYYCFSCKRGGGVINFIMEYEKLSYMEAVTLLADRVGMEVPAAQDGGAWQQNRNRKKTLHALMREAARFYHACLMAPGGARCREYLKGRGVEKEIVPFGLGFAPDSFEALTKHLLAKGYKEQDLLDAGVAKKKDRHLYDAFRGRAMFPIQDVTGEVIAFGGRILGEGDPKYLNSPETVIFNKRRNLYALNSVKKRTPLKSLLLVEGYMDVVALSGAGIHTAVASLGTAFTKEQAKLMKRYVEQVYVCYDGDEAGQNASFKAVDILREEGLSCKVITLPDNMDPDEFVRKYGRAKFYDLAAKAPGGTRFQLLRLAREFRLEDGDEAVRYATRCAAHLKNLDNQIEKEQEVRWLAARTGLSADSIYAQMGTAPAVRYTVPEKETQSTQKPADNREARVLALLLRLHSFSDPEVLPREEDFPQEGFRRIFLFLQEQINRGISPIYDEIIHEFGETFPREIRSLTEAAAQETLGDPAEELRGLLRLMRTDRLKGRQKALLLQLSQTEDSTTKTRLLREVAEISQALHQLKEQ